MPRILPAAASNAPPLRAALLATVALSALTPSARAVDVFWDNTSGDGQFETPENWSTDLFPVAEDDAVFVDPNAGPATIDTDIVIPASPRDVRFGTDNTPGTGTINHTAGTLSMPGWVRLGMGGAGSGGTYNMSGTGVLEASSYRFAETVGSDVTVEQTGGTIRQSDVVNIEDGGGWPRIGESGVLTYNLSGGTLSMDSRTLISTNSVGGSDATINQTGGTFEVRRGELIIGDASAATYNISGGTLQTLNPTGTIDTIGHLTIGQWDGSNGTLNVSGNAVINVAANLQVAAGRTAALSQGQVNQTGGTINVEGDLTLGVQDNPAEGPENKVSSYNLSGGTLNLTGGQILVGTGGDDTFTFTGGRLQDAGTINLDLNQQGGTLAPGASPGTTTINGSYTQAAAAVYEAEVEGDGTAHDLVNVNGAATIAGGLDVLAAGASPTGYVPIPILTTTGGLTGRFPNAEVDGATATANGLSLAPVYDSDSVELVPAIPGDANLDRTVSVGDVGILATHFGGSDKFWENADFNFDGQVTVGDVGILATNFGRTFGGLTDTSMTFDQVLALPEFADFRTALAAVPEPAGTLALLGMAAGGCLRRRHRRGV